MGNYDCKKALSDMFSCDVPEKELAQHLENCESCAKEYKDLLKMKNMVLNSAPETPDIKSKVVSRIEREGIKIKEQKPAHRRFIPFGTIAAAAAVLVIYLSAKGTPVFDMLSPETENFAVNDTDSAEIITEDAVSQGSGGALRAVTFGAQAQKDKSYADTVVTESEPAPESEAILYSAVMDDVAFSKNSATITALPKNSEFVSDTKDSAAVPLEMREKAEAVFEEKSALYPDRISRELFEKAGHEKYLAFVQQISDFDAEYTEETFCKFLEE